MNQNKQQRYVLIICMVSLIYTGGAFANSVCDDNKQSKDFAKSSLLYDVKASKPRLNRNIIGEVVAELHGVPAEPVDSFAWDGIGSVAVKGKACLKIDPITNKGEIWVEWEDQNGYWTYHQTSFSPPAHPTGLQVGSSARQRKIIENDPVTHNVYLHGDTTAAAPVLPTVFNYITTWGPAKVTLNGNPFVNRYDGPAPNWLGHTMTTTGVRKPDGTVRTISGGIYNFSQAGKGAADNNDLEFHLVFHDAPGPTSTTNLPAPFSFFYHLTFEKVKVKIKNK